MRLINTISKWIEKLIDTFSIVALMAMCVIFFAAVFARYVMNSGIGWAEEFTRFANISMVVLGVSSAARHRGNINVGVIDTVPKTEMGKKILFTVQQSIMGVFFFIMGVIGINFAMSVQHVSPTMQIPMGVMYGIIGVAAILTAFQCLVYILNLFFNDGEFEEGGNES